MNRCKRTAKIRKINQVLNRKGEKLNFSSLSGRTVRKLYREVKDA